MERIILGGGGGQGDSKCICSKVRLAMPVNTITYCVTLSKSQPQHPCM